MKPLTAIRLREVLSYNRFTGVFRRRLSTHPRWCAGRVAGGLNGSGYLKIAVDGQLYFAHRLAWLYVHGHFPPKETDHINGVRDDNRLSNLRECDRAKNGMNLRRKSNNTSGFPGVSLDKRGKWEAYIHFKRKKIVLGRFNNPTDAAVARKKGEQRYFGDFARLQ